MLIATATTTKIQRKSKPMPNQWHEQRKEEKRKQKEQKNCNGKSKTNK